MGPTRHCLENERPLTSPPPPDILLPGDGPDRGLGARFQCAGVLSFLVEHLSCSASPSVPFRDLRRPSYSAFSSSLVATYFPERSYRSSNSLDFGEPLEDVSLPDVPVPIAGSTHIARTEVLENAN